MSVEKVRNWLRRWGRDEAVIELAESSATSDLAASAVGVRLGRIAKTLTFAAGKETADKAGAIRNRQGGGKVVPPVPAGMKAENAPDLACILVVASGDARIDGKKFKDRFGLKSKMLAPEEVLARTGHGVGGVCPFAVDNPEAEIYLDLSLKRFSTVYPACGSANSLMEIDCEELFRISGAKDWVDVCKDWEPASAGNAEGRRE